MNVPQFLQLFGELKRFLTLVRDYRRQSIEFANFITVTAD